MSHHALGSRGDILATCRVSLEIFMDSRRVLFGEPDRACRGADAKNRLKGAFHEELHVCIDDLPEHLALNFVRPYRNVVVGLYRERRATAETVHRLEITPHVSAALGPIVKDFWRTANGAVHAEDEQLKGSGVDQGLDRLPADRNSAKIQCVAIVFQRLPVILPGRLAPDRGRHPLRPPLSSCSSAAAQPAPHSEAGGRSSTRTRHAGEPRNRRRWRREACDVEQQEPGGHPAMHRRGRDD
mmetsp:Transcript_65932/g.183680  ORF Transcript_65932/g.183680 Transcript_65932/m.183680 type:complete len:241 (+) Transcript_65932:350-1072(+)